MEKIKFKLFQRIIYGTMFKHQKEIYHFGEHSQARYDRKFINFCIHKVRNKQILTLEDLNTLYKIFAYSMHPIYAKNEVRAILLGKRIHKAECE